MFDLLLNSTDWLLRDWMTKAVPWLNVAKGYSMPTGDAMMMAHVTVIF